MKKWRKLASKKAEVEQQNDSILAAIKNNKIDKEFGQLSGEELFKPITSRLDKLQVGAAPKEEKEEVPDYGMDEFDLKGQFHGSAHVHIIYSPVHALLQGPLFHCL